MVVLTLSYPHHLLQEKIRFIMVRYKQHSQRAMITGVGIRHVGANCIIVVHRFTQPTLSAGRHSLLECTSQPSTPFEATSTNHPNIYALSSFATGSIVLISLSSMGLAHQPLSYQTHRYCMLAHFLLSLLQLHQRE